LFANTIIAAPREITAADIEMIELGNKKVLKRLSLLIIKNSNSKRNYKILIDLSFTFVVLNFKIKERQTLRQTSRNNENEFVKM
jgi:hypothetical protein